MRIGLALPFLVATIPPLSAQTVRSLDVTVPLISSPVASDGKTILAFEVHATNIGSVPVRLRTVRIIDADDGQVIVAYSGEALMQRVAQPNAASNAEPTTIAAGGRAILYVEPELHGGRNPRALSIEMDGVAPDGQRFTLRSPAKTVDRTRSPVLAPPLKEGIWVAVHDPAWERGHRRVIYTLDGRAHIPGRYAIDWVGVDARGRVSAKDPDRPADAIGYGVPVLAGADAEVAATRDDMQEAGSIAGNPAHALGDGSGNYVVLRLTGNRYAFYEHLRPRSINVRVGDHVRTGQTIGAVGFTGDTTGPHLHLHVADCSLPLACEGFRSW